MQIELAQNYNELDLVMNDEEHPQFFLQGKEIVRLAIVHLNQTTFLAITYIVWFQIEVSKSRNKQLAQLFGSGLGIHHAGMLRSDRGLTERLFSDGLFF